MTGAEARVAGHGKSEPARPRRGGDGADAVLATGDDPLLNVPILRGGVPPERRGRSDGFTTAFAEANGFGIGDVFHANLIRPAPGADDHLRPRCRLSSSTPSAPAR